MEEREGVPKNVFQSLWTAIPIFLGMILPWLGGPVSLVWSILFGLSEILFLWFPYDLEHPLAYAVFAVIVWPALVAIFLRWISGVVWESTRAPGRWIAVGVLLLLSSPFVSHARAEREPMISWPSYLRAVEGLW